jgi:hypothetical protein
MITFTSFLDKEIINGSVTNFGAFKGVICLLFVFLEVKCSFLEYWGKFVVKNTIKSRLEGLSQSNNTL